MAARFAGSKSLDERRRRRIATEENQQSPRQDSSEAPAERELPTRRPTGRFPLRRLVPSSRWKLTGAAFAAIVIAGLAIGVGQFGSVQSGALGPGVRELFDLQDGQFASSVAGLLLLASGQLAWLIRWARSRSLQDFRGGYRIWWWASAALMSAGVVVLSEAHQAFAATIVWATGRQLFGSDAAYQALPALVSLLVLIPSLQSEMRGCTTSRSLILVAVGFWLLGIGGIVGDKALSGTLTSLGVQIPAVIVTQAVLMVGTATAFSGLLFHARHVVYESVEPPPAKVRKRPSAQQEQDAAAPAEEEATAPARKPRRSARTSKKAAAVEPVEKTEAATSAEEPPATAAPASPKEVAVVEAKAKTEVLASQPSPSTRPSSAKPSAAARTSVEEIEEEEDGESEASFNGRNLRLDEPEDLRGMSKRERRKMRKAMKDRERMEMQS